MALGKLAVFCALAAVLMMAGCIGGPAGNQTAPSCGNKALEGGEQCEAGIPCQNSSLTCNSDCRCVPPSAGAKQNVSCAMNAGRVNNGTSNTFNPATMVCKDDCKAFDPNSVCDSASCTCTSSCASGGIKAAVGGALNNSSTSFNATYEICKDDCKKLNPNSFCDAKTCSCRIPVPLPRGCLANSFITSFTGVNSFDPRSMICQDDCWRVDPAMTCTAACICQKPPPVNCAANTNKVNAGAPNTFNPAAMQCKDDCKNIDPALSCDAKTCTCKKPPQPSCFFNSFATAITGKNEFNPLGGLACADDCKKFDPTLNCNPITCICEETNKTKANETLTCATNTLFAMDSAGGSIYDPAKYRCEDNCKQFDPNLACDGTTCTCKKIIENRTTSCAANTRPSTSTLEKAPPGTMCKDDCQSSYGSDYICEPLSCQCIQKSRLPQFSCLNNSLESIWGGEKAPPLPFNNMCADDCNDTSFYCDGTSCVCKPKVNVTGGTSCSGNTYDTIYSGGQNGYKPGALCKDDCANVLGSEYACDGKSCTCEPKPAGNASVSCAGRTEDSAGSSAEKLGPGLICKDDCGQYMGSGYSCDPASCTCRKEEPKNVSCVENSYQALDSGNKTGPLPAAYRCEDDCAKEDPLFACDPVQCVCKPKVNETAGTTSCMRNTYEAYYNGDNSTYSGATQCRDDCKELDPGSVCDATTCTCKPPQTENLSVSCAGNTNSGASTLEKAGPGVMCRDDCASLGSGYACDAISCTCVQHQTTGRTEVSCAASSVVSELGNGAFDPKLMICIDNCDKIDPDLQCDKTTCSCKPYVPPKSMSCQGNSVAVGIFQSGNAFDPGATRCEDDCKDLDEGLACDGKTCTCKQDTSVSCSANTFVFGMTGGYLGGSSPQSMFGPGLQCKDDCAQLNPGSYCDPTACICKTQTTTEPQLSCAGRTAPGATTVGKPPYGVMCKDDCASLGSGYTCDGASCTCKPPAVTENQTNQTTGRCGDGVTTYPEQCDLGSYMTNKCPQGKYCTKDCACKAIENTPVCGDGKISSPGEDCDNGNVATSICQSGYSCKLCKCVPSTSIAQCGDGTVTPPEECDPGNSYTAMCPNGNLCNNCKCSTPTGTTTPQHTVCDYSHGACVSVNGTGTNECTSDSQCTQTAPQYHNVCSGGRCVSASGSGTDQCSSDSQCSQTAPQTHTECDFTHGACVTVNGSGASTCGSNSDCVPPALNCPSYCSGQGFSQSLGSGYTSSDQCKAAASESAVQCTTTCIYTSFYSVSNQAGTSTCCCKAKYTYSCTNCPAQPGTQPYCPQCPSSKPG